MIRVDDSHLLKTSMGAVAMNRILKNFDIGLTLAVTVLFSRTSLHVMFPSWSARERQASVAGHDGHRGAFSRVLLKHLECVIRVGPCCMANPASRPRTSFHAPRPQTLSCLTSSSALLPLTSSQLIGSHSRSTHSSRTHPSAPTG